jgi:AraC-like DNA-binding protein
MIPTLKLLEAAAAPTRERIRRDHGRAPRQIQPLLAHIEEHLFDPDLDANRLKLACGVRDNTLPIRFHDALDLPPYGYIEDCRMEVACRLLADTELKVWQVAQLLGYSTLQVFSRAFHRWSGLRPTSYRRQCCRDYERRARRPPADAKNEPISWSTLRKAASGRLRREEADALARHLEELYPESFATPVRAAL